MCVRCAWCSSLWLRSLCIASSWLWTTVYWRHRQAVFFWPASYQLYSTPQPSSSWAMYHSSLCCWIYMHTSYLHQQRHAALISTCNDISRVDPSHTLALMFTDEYSVPDYVQIWCQWCKQDQILKAKVTKPSPRSPEVNKGTWRV